VIDDAIGGWGNNEGNWPRFLNILRRPFTRPTATPKVANNVDNPDNTFRRAGYTYSLKKGMQRTANLDSRSRSSRLHYSRRLLLYARRTKSSEGDVEEGADAIASRSQTVPSLSREPGALSRQAFSWGDQIDQREKRWCSVPTSSAMRVLVRDS